MSKNGWRDAIARALGRSDNTEHGVGSGRGSDNVHGHHTYNDLGITDRQQEVMDAYLRNDRSLHAAAAELGISKNGVTNALYAIGERLGIEGHDTDEIVETFFDTFSGTTSDADASNPWSGYWDEDGNWVD